MQQSDIDQMEASATYRKLVASRRRFRLTMTALMTLIYYGFILLVALAPHMLARPFFRGGVISTGIVVGIGIVIGSVAMTGFYVLRANRTFDPAMSSLLVSAGRGD
ncbi:DUF485 domain-containing protein [Caballeronia insecticola]|uniref:DUF485 domain-containing protein n=1 Tax=Caballeronia insecticola TaxID=758793 RepID=A0A060PRT4_9BURK|nr:DUF485 domain-containing protein [Caballeronia insecticola]BAO94155.1 putative uncharacterized protein [Caballeronia insecticola]